MTEGSTASSHNGANHLPKADKSSGQFIRSRWFHVVTLADQLRRNTAQQRSEQFKQYAFEIPPLDARSKLLPTSLEAQAERVESFQDELLHSKARNLNLDGLTEKFVELQRTFNRMLLLQEHDVQQVTLATSITKTALLMVQRSAELIVDILTRRTRKFSTLNSLISFIRSCPDQLPIHGQLLVDWYAAAEILDLLLKDPDWLVQPRKAHWAMNICNETLAWARATFNHNHPSKSTKRAIFDRDDSFVLPESQTD